MEKIPADFAFSLSMNQKARDYYSTLSLDTQYQINEYINSATSLDETRFRINESINALSNLDTNFLFFL